ncbi:MAG: DUF3540 domain-containing protein [Polyangiaceae bacterium]|nr:DUF3540 domain-containing protein [Polyangiaceae bacterium]
MSTAKKVVSLAQAARRAAVDPQRVPQWGHVAKVLDAPAFEVAVSGGSLRAERAPSCLLVPEVGDEVWLLPRADGAWVVGAVLGRAATGAAVVSLPGEGTELSAAGRLRVRGGRALELGAPTVSVRADVLDVTAQRTRLASHAVDLFAARVTAGLETARLVAKKLDAAIDSVAMRLERSFRWVTEVEQVRAGQLDLEAKGNLRAHGDCAFVSAERVVQVRGEEVHLS